MVLALNGLAAWRGQQADANSAECGHLRGGVPALLRLVGDERRYLGRGDHRRELRKPGADEVSLIAAGQRDT